MGLGLAFRSFFAALGNGYEAKRIAEALAPVECHGPTPVTDDGYLHGEGGIAVVGVPPDDSEELKNFQRELTEHEAWLRKEENLKLFWTPENIARLQVEIQKIRPEAKVFKSKFLKDYLEVTYAKKENCYTSMTNDFDYAIKSVTSSIACRLAHQNVGF